MLAENERFESAIASGAEPRCSQMPPPVEAAQLEKDKLDRESDTGSCNKSAPPADPPTPAAPEAAEPAALRLNASPDNDTAFVFENDALPPPSAADARTDSELDHRTPDDAVLDCVTARSPPRPPAALPAKTHANGSTAWDAGGEGRRTLGIVVVFVVLQPAAVSL